MIVKQTKWMRCGWRLMRKEGTWYIHLCCGISFMTALGVWNDILNGWQLNDSFVCVCEFEMNTRYYVIEMFLEFSYFQMDMQTQYISKEFENNCM
jgi:hypothetical protein